MIILSALFSSALILALGHCRGTQEYGARAPFAELFRA